MHYHNGAGDILRAVIIGVTRELFSGYIILL